MPDEKVKAIRWGLVCTSIGVLGTTVAKVIVAMRGSYYTPQFDILDTFSSLATLLWFFALIGYFYTLRRGTPAC